MAAASHRLHLLAVNHNPSVVIAKPAPSVGSADRIHDLLFEHLRKWPPPEVQRSEREYVHSRIVVFVDGSSLIARPREPFVRLVSRPVRPCALAPKRSLPVAGLSKQMIPGDGAVVRRAEQIDDVSRAQPVGTVLYRQRVIKLDWRHVVARDVVDATDQAVVIRDADHTR